MDQVFIRGLEVQAVIGAYDWERTIRQRLVLDLEMDWDIRPAAAEDDLTLALDYAAVSQRVLDYVSASSFELVETKQLLPEKDGPDGFFMALMRKRI